MWPFNRRQSTSRAINAKLDVAQTTANNRKHWANADGLSARAALSPNVRRVVRIRSRYEAENNSWYSGILRTAVNHIVGNGPRLQMMTGNTEANQRIERAFRRWSKQIDFIDTLRTSTEAYWRDGEVFMMRSNRPRNFPITLDVRIFEADQIATPWDGTAYNDPFIDDGIRFDRSTNELELYVYDNHPGGNVPVSTLNGEWYSSKEVLHLFRADRPGQTRGIPRVTPALQTLPVMRRQEMATLYAAESAANFAMYLKSTAPTIEAAQFASDFNEIEITANLLTQLPPGWDLGQVKPEQPTTTFNAFQMQTLQSFCRCTNMPYTLAAGTGKDANFSSFRGDMKNVWEPEVKCEQSRIEFAILEPVFKWFLEALVFIPGMLDGLPSISELDYTFYWPPLPELDALDAANAASVRMSTLQSGPHDEFARRGLEYESECVRIAADWGVDVPTLKAAAFAKTFGLTPGAPMPTAPMHGQANATALPQGEYTSLGQRAFTNNQKRIKNALTQLTTGEASQVLVEQTLASIGLAPDRIAALIADALDGGVEDSTVQEVAV